MLHNEEKGILNRNYEMHEIHEKCRVGVWVAKELK